MKITSFKKDNNMSDNKIIIASEDTPDNETLSVYVESLKTIARTIDLDKETKEMIDSLPSPKQIRKRLSFSECAVLNETVGYLWKKFTGDNVSTSSRDEHPKDQLKGNYWLIHNGILLDGINHFTIAKQNLPIFCTLLGINAMAMQHYIHAEPNKLILLIIKNGGIRMFVDQQKRLFAQMSPETYAKWGKTKVKKYDVKKTIIKIVDLSKSYDGWNSGIEVKI